MRSIEGRCSFLIELFQFSLLRIPSVCYCSSSSHAFRSTLSFFRSAHPSVLFGCKMSPSCRWNSSELTYLPLCPGRVSSYALCTYIIIITLFLPLFLHLLPTANQVQMCTLWNMRLKVFVWLQDNVCFFFLFVFWERERANRATSSVQHMLQANAELSQSLREGIIR